MWPTVPSANAVRSKTLPCFVEQTSGPKHCVADRRCSPTLRTVPPGSWMPAICASPPNDVLARVSILSVGLDADNRLHPVSGSSSSLTPAASARALTIAAAVGPGAASLVPRKGCPGRSQQRRGGAQGRRARRTRPGVSAQSILVCDFAAVGGGWWRFWTITRRRQRSAHSIRATVICRLRSARSSTFSPRIWV
jgi:hypothetical protein